MPRGNLSNAAITGRREPRERKIVDGNAELVGRIHADMTDAINCQPHPHILSRLVKAEVEVMWSKGASPL